MNCLDVLNLLFTNINEKNLENCLKIIEYYHKQKYDKNKLIVHMLNHVSEFYMTRNLWVLDKLVQDVEQVPQIISILINIDKKPLIIKINKQRISEWIKNSLFEHEILSKYKILPPELFKLLNILYTNLISHTNAKESLIIIAYMVKKQKTICDVIFDLLESNTIRSDIERYIKLCKELFYYKSKPSDRIKRINFLNYAVYVSIQQELHDYPLNIIEIKEQNPLDYLFVYFDRDLTLEECVEQDRNVYKEDWKQTEIKNVFYK